MLKKLKEFVPAHKSALLLMLLLGILHLGILLTSQAHVDGDEGVVGIMGLHILLRHEHPLFFYGQVYGTGAALEAYPAALVFAIFGPSSIALKMISLSLFWGALVLVYIIALRFLPRRQALWAIALFGLATPLIEWRTKMRGGYAGIPFFCLLIVLCYLQIVDKEQKLWWRYLLLGLAIGAAWFNSSLALSLLVALFLHSLLIFRRFYRPAVLIIPLGILIALSPLLISELQTGFQHTRYLLSLVKSTPTLQDLQKVIMNFLPRFFVPRNVDQYIQDLPWSGWLEYCLYAGMFFAGVLLLVTKRTDSAPRRLLGLMLLAVITHLVLFIFNGNRDQSPRYLLPIYVPLLFIALIVQYQVELQFSQAGWRHAPGLILALLIGMSLYNNLTYLRPASVTDDIQRTDGSIVNVQTDGKLALRLIDYLQSQNVGYVRTGYFLQWRILFESRETIIASSRGYSPTVVRFKEYDKQVGGAQRVAIILHRDSSYLQEAVKTALAKGMKRVEIDDYVVFTP
jgi:4-amino-4-deoxy-L-arabinose transferase-like glycosyltransferase